MGEAGAPGTQLVVVLGALLRTLIALGAPGHTHGAAARIDAMLPCDRGGAALILVGQVAVLCAQVWVGGGTETFTVDTLCVLHVKISVFNAKALI